MLTTLARRSEPNDDIFRLYHALIAALGSERTILNDRSPDEIARHSFPGLANTILAQPTGQLDFATLRTPPTPPAATSSQLPLF